MTFLPRTPRATWALAGLLWLAGAAALWWALPGVPAAWQPPAGEIPAGFLRDSRSLVTVAMNPADPSRPRGPLRLWDVDTGGLLAQHRGPEDPLGQPWLDPHDRLWITDTDPALDAYRLRALDPRSGRPVAELTGRRNGAVGWRLAPDGQTAVVSDDAADGTEQLAWVEVASGRVLRTFPDCRGAFCLSPDGRRLAARRRQVRDPGRTTVAVWDLPTGQEIATLTQPAEDLVGPAAFTADGALLADQWGNVRDVATGRRRVAGGPAVGGSSFSPDGRWLVAQAGRPPNVELAWYDLATGAEDPARRLVLLRGDPRRVIGPDEVRPGAAVLRVLLQETDEPWFVLRWLGALPWAGRLVAADRADRMRTLLIDGTTGRPAATWAGWLYATSPDGRRALVLGPDSRNQLWDVPPRKPPGWFLGLAAAWAAALALAARRRLRGVAQPHREGIA